VTSAAVLMTGVGIGLFLAALSESIADPSRPVFGWKAVAGLAFLTAAVMLAASL